MHGASNKVESHKEETCCVAGHRDIPANQMAHVKQELRRAVKAAIADGYRLFLTDFMEAIHAITVACDGYIVGY